MSGDELLMDMRLDDWQMPATTLAWEVSEYIGQLGFESGHFQILRCIARRGAGDPRLTDTRQTIAFIDDLLSAVGESGQLFPERVELS